MSYEPIEDDVELIRIDGRTWYAQQRLKRRMQQCLGAGFVGGLLFWTVLLLFACSSAQPCEPAELEPFPLCGMVCQATACSDLGDDQVDVHAFECTWPDGSATFCEPFASCWSPATCAAPPPAGCEVCS